MIHRIPLTLTFLMFFSGTQAPAGEITIRGRVIDAEREGLPGVTVELRPWLSSFDEGLRLVDAGDVAEPLATARSDGHGYFKLTAPAGSSYQLEVEARGRAPMLRRLAHLFADVELETIELPPAEKVRVRVSDEGGAPIAGARVYVSQYGYGDRWLPAAQRARAGDDGAVAARRVAGPGRRGEPRGGWVWAYAAGRVPAGADLSSGGPVTLALEAGVARAIEVRDAGGKPVAGALVRHGENGWPAGTSGDDGRLIVYPPASGDLYVTIETADGRWGRGRVTAPEPEDAEPVRIDLEPPAAVTGRILDAEADRPLPGARVWLESDPGRFAESGRDGGYRLTFPPNRWYRLRAAATGYLPETVQSRGSQAGDEFARDFALRPEALLRGRVHDVRGGPIEGAEVAAHSPRHSERRHFTRSRPDGGFQLTVAHNVLYGLSVSKPGYQTARTEAAAGADAESIEVVLRPGIAGFGRVVDLGERPVAGAEVSLSASRRGPPRHRFEPEPAPEHRAVTDAEGRFEVANLAPGGIDLRVTARGYAEIVIPGVEVAEVGDGAAADLGTVVLEPGVRVEGRVVDPDGRPLAGAAVHWMPWRGDDFRGFSGMGTAPEVTTDAAGRFVIEDLARGGKISIEARLRGYDQATAPGVEAPADEPVVLVLVPQGKIRGEAVDGHGEPVPETMVYATYESAGGSSHSSGTGVDADGRFELEVTAGRLKLSASSPDHRSNERSLEVAPGQVVDGVRLVLEPGAVVEGRVLGSAGEAIAGAWVSAHMMRMSAGPGRIVTDSDGRFRIGGLETGELYLSVHLDGFPSVDRQIEVKPGVNSVEIRLLETHEVHGRVVDEALAPVGGAQVALVPAGRGRPSNAVSGADGSFVAEASDGLYRLIAFKDGFGRAEADDRVEVAGGPVFGLEVRFVEGGAIVGRVLGVEPDRLANVIVSTDDPRSSFSPIDHQGRYRLEHLKPGEWTVVATEPPTGRTARGRVTLHPGEREATLDLEFTPGLTLAGRVVIDGEPAPGTHIEIRGLDVASQNRTATDYRGRFRVVDLQPGRYRLELRRDELVERRELELTTDREIEIELSTLGVAGRVVDDGDGRPLAGAWVALEPAGADVSASRPPGYSTDSSGNFRFARVAEGDYLVRVQLEDYAPLALPLAVASGVDLESLELRLTRAEGLTLRIHLASGQVPQRVMVTALDAADQVALNTWLGAAEGGAMRVSSLPAGRWRLLVGAPGAATLELAVDAPGDPVDVVLPPETRLEVRVPELEGSAELAALTLTGPNGRPFLELSGRSMHPIRQWTVRDGRANVTGVPPGPWLLTVTAPDGRTWNASVVTAPAGGAVPVDVE